jgi:hypothetical protein
MDSFRPEELPISRDPGLLVDRVADFPEADFGTRTLGRNSPSLAVALKCWTGICFFECGGNAMK